MSDVEWIKSAKELLDEKNAEIAALKRSRDHLIVEQRETCERVTQLTAELAAEREAHCACEITNHRLHANLTKLREALEALLTEAEDVFVCMADATGTDRHNLPKSFRRASAVLAETGGGDD